MNELVSVAKRKPKMIDIMPADIVEGMLGETLREIKASVDMWHANVGDLSPEQHANATSVIVAHLVGSSIDFLQHHSDASLSPKHRAVRHVMNSMVERLDLNPAGGDCDLDRLARDMVEFLTAYHVCLLDRTSKRGRREAEEAFCGGIKKVN
jgi:hypothetical protein